MTRARAWALAAVLAAASSATLPAPLSAQSLRLGDDVRITPKARLDTDIRGASSVDHDDDVDLDLARRRIGVTGTVTSRIEFEVEREVGPDGRWRDVFVDGRVKRGLQIRAGHFKVPFSREQLTGPGGLDFIDRSRAVDLLAPGRSAGVALHGRVADRVVGYEAGAFVRDGTRGLAAPADSEPTVAARLTIRPRGSARRAGSLADLEVGVGAAASELVEGRSSLRGRLTTNEVFFAPVLVSGRRLRVGGDLDWRPGPFGVRAEFLRADDARQHQGLLGETLPPLRAQGWYVSGVWAVAGRQAHAKANDRRLAVAGLAGLELAVRAESLSFGTPGAAASQLWTPRAEQLSTVTDRVWTFGVNWTVNRLVRLQANAVREAVVDRSRGAAPPRAAWSSVARIQVAM